MSPSVQDCVFAEPAAIADIVVQSGADVRRYEVQRFKQVLGRPVTTLNLGTYKEAIRQSGLTALDNGSDWYKDDTDIDQDGKWRSLNVSDDLGLPEKPVKVMVMTRAKSTTPSDASHLHIRAGSGDNGTDHHVNLPSVAGIYNYSEGFVSLSSARAGTHNGSTNASTLSDNTQSWTTNQFVNRTLKNLTDGSEGKITANTSTTITATLAGGTDNDWDVGDNYEIFAVSGTHDGSNNASVLADSTASWTTNAYRGLRIKNTTDGSEGSIESNTATTITASLKGGTDNDWDAGDAYEIVDNEGGFFQVRAESNVTAFDIKVKGYFH